MRAKEMKIEMSSRGTGSGSGNGKGFRSVEGLIDFGFGSGCGFGQMPAEMPRRKPKHIQKQRELTHDTKSRGPKFANKVLGL